MNVNIVAFFTNFSRKGMVFSTTNINLADYKNLRGFRRTGRVMAVIYASAMVRSKAGGKIRYLTILKLNTDWLPLAANLVDGILQIFTPGFFLDLFEAFGRHFDLDLGQCSAPD